MKKSKLLLCTMFAICFLSFGTFAEGNPPLCRDGQTPINGRCSDGNPPRQVADEPGDTQDQTTLEEFFEWVQSLF